MNTAVRRSVRPNAFYRRPHVVLALMTVVANATPAFAQVAGDTSAPGPRFSNEAIAAHAKWLAQTSPPQPNTTAVERSWGVPAPHPNRDTYWCRCGSRSCGQKRERQPRDWPARWSRGWSVERGHSVGRSATALRRVG